MTIQCVILAGGLATRMRPMTETIPKAMLLVRGRPFVEYQLDWLAGQGVKDVLMCTAHLGQQLRDHVDTGRRWGLDVEYSDEGPVLAGTGGALRLAITRQLVDESFLVVYGDSYLDVSILDCVRAWDRSRLPALMTVLRNEGRWDRSNTLFVNGTIKRYDKTGAPQAARFDHIDYGLLGFRRTILEAHIDEGGPADLATVQATLARLGQLAGYEVKARFYEIGSPTGLADFDRFLGTHAGNRVEGELVAPNLDVLGPEAAAHEE